APNDPGSRGLSTKASTICGCRWRNMACWRAMKSLAALESRSAVNDVLQQADPEIWQAIDDERRRQQQGLEMIASENYTSPAVMAAQGSVLTNKYAEGYPGRRYYGGCEFVDR